MNTHKLGIFSWFRIWSYWFELVKSIIESWNQVVVFLCCRKQILQEKEKSGRWFQTFNRLIMPLINWRPVYMFCKVLGLFCLTVIFVYTNFLKTIWSYVIIIIWSCTMSLANNMFLYVPYRTDIVGLMKGPLLLLNRPNKLQSYIKKDVKFFSSRSHHLILRVSSLHSSSPTVLILKRRFFFRADSHLFFDLSFALWN